jgi:hypothetical protein
MPTCSLDVAALVAQGEGPPTLEVIGAWLGVTRERIRQVAREAMRKFAEEARRRRLPWKIRGEQMVPKIENEIPALIPERGMTALEIQAGTGHSKTVIRYHLGQLARCGLITRRPERNLAHRWRWYVANTPC